MSTTCKSPAELREQATEDLMRWVSSADKQEQEKAATSAANNPIVVKRRISNNVRSCSREIIKRL